MKFRHLAVAAAVGAVGMLLISTAFGITGPPAAKPLFASMSGKKEVSATGQKNVGDKDGRGAASAIIDGGKLCFGITVRDIDDPVAAHIHKGSPKVAGPIALTLTAPSSGDPGASSGCVDISASLATAIRKNPHKYYVNVHTDAFPGGAVRSQLFSR